MNEQSPEEVLEEVLITSSTNKEETKETTNMQTTEVVENSENSDDTTIVKPTTDSTSENVPPTQIEEEENMNDIPGIRVSMATIVELPPLEEQQRLSDENAPAVSEKVIDEIFSSIITYPEEQQQIKPSEIPNQQESQPTELTETNVTNEMNDVPPAIDATKEANEDIEDNASNEINEEIETILTSETSVVMENTERPVEDITENINKTNEISQDIQNSQNSSIIQEVESVQNSSNPSVIQDVQSVQNVQSTPNIQNAPIVHDAQQSVQVTQNAQSSPIMQNVKDIQNPQNVPVPVEDVRSDPTVQNMQDIQKNQDVQNSQIVQSTQSTQQPMIIDQDISQQPPEQKPEQIVNDKTVQPVASELNEVPPPQQLQQLSIPPVQNVSGATNDDVQPMDTLNTSSDEYKNAPPPSTLTTPTGTFDYEDAIKKAHAIAAKLLNNEGGTVVQNQQSTNAQQGVKRSHEDSYNSHGSTRDSRDDYRDDYRRDSYNRRDRVRYDDYGRDSKRAAYDSGGSRPEYDSSSVGGGNSSSGGSGGGGGGGGNRHRYGLGNEERRSHHGSHYGPGDSRGAGHEEFKVPNAVVGLVIGRGGENLKRIEKTTGARIQFSQDQPPDVIERRVTITGQVDDVKTARAMIQQLVEDASNGTLTGRRDSHGGGGGGGNRTTMTIHIPVNKVGVVIGRGGETIRDLQDRSGARINVTPDSAASPQSNDRSVTLIGDEAAVQRAKALIDEIVNAGDSNADRSHSKDYRSSNYGSNYSSDSHHGSSYGGSHYGSSNHGQYGSHHSGKSNQNQDSITIQVPNDSVGLIIGKGGETVRALQLQSGAKIQIEPVHGATPVDRNVQIIGTAENIAIAKSLILEKAASGNRERPSRHNSDQGRNDYGSSGYQQSGYQQGSGYQQSGYQQSSYRQGTYQPNNYQQGSGGYPQSSGYQQSGVSNPNVTNSNTGYQQTGYPTNTYNPAPQQQTTYQNTSNDYVQNATSSYPSANTYGVTGQQPQTAYGQYNQYGTTQNTTPYNQYPNTQYGAYGQPTQYNQPTAGQVGQPTVQPTVQPVIQPVIQAVGNQPTGQPTQVGYYPTQPTTMDPTKVGSVNEIKQDPQPINATPNYSYQFPYNYGTPSSNQYPSVATGQIQTATVSQAASGYPILGATAYSSPATLNTGTTANTAPTGSGDQTNLQYPGYYTQQYSPDQYNQQPNYYQQYFQQQQQQQQPQQQSQQPTAYNYQTTPTNLPSDASKP
ncbi:hypothetical protein RclHR1_05540004 [Rhizophagus clarus]|uniref:Far upstream element-binding protein 3 isoform X1 n=1 Tax=Rhizophagus clarus TaxID=94130 RepID=A0A2Z6RPG3_9GLOM|nr:hypothetical protein RclHR1_05540004 [Rhizophagus clarus]GES90751.1 far upstream element-binding protein 3 isoform X1 [Rhizophagus clarus]